jgi:hypothetical protein
MIAPLQFFLCSLGYFKKTVYVGPPICPQNLKDEISAACNQLIHQQIPVSKNKQCTWHAESYFVHGGQLFEKYIR